MCNKKSKEHLNIGSEGNKSKPEVMLQQILAKMCYKKSKEHRNTGIKGNKSKPEVTQPQTLAKTCNKTLRDYILEPIRI